MARGNFRAFERRHYTKTQMQFSRKKYLHVIIFIEIKFAKICSALNEYMLDTIETP